MQYKPFIPSIYYFAASDIQSFFLLHTTFLPHTYHLPLQTYHLPAFHLISPFLLHIILLPPTCFFSPPISSDLLHINIQPPTQTLNFFLIPSSISVNSSSCLLPGSSAPGLPPTQLPQVLGDRSHF